MTREEAIQQASYKRKTASHITSLHYKLAEETARAEKAEHGLRQLAAELSRWKDRALVAEASLISAGRPS